MSGERRPSPEWQVRTMLGVARDAGLPFAEAWPLTVDGQVCDDYRSARGKVAPRDTDDDHGGPPNLRVSVPERGGHKHCAGCRFVAGAATEGLARCTLHGVDVYAGVLWPHRTDDRKEWQAAIRTAAAEWERCYSGQPSPAARVLDALRRFLTEGRVLREEDDSSVAA